MATNKKPTHMLRAWRNGASFGLNDPWGFGHRRVSRAA